jgi:CRP-like cAMP-binding protein
MDNDVTDFAALSRSIGTVRRWRSGDIVFAEGDAADCAYLVLSGEVEIESSGRIIERVMPGEAIGVVSLIDDLPRSATARVAVESELVALDRRRFRYMVEQVPLFVWFVMKSLTGRLRATKAAL